MHKGLKMPTDFDAEFQQAKTATLPLPIWSEADSWDEATIPLRPWIVRGYFLRGSVTLIAGPGSAGKSSLTVGWSVAAALGLDLGRFKAPEPLTVLLFNVEDDAEEQRRRLSAALRQHGGTPADVKGRVIRCGPQDIGTLIERDAKTGEIFLTRAWDALEALIKARKPEIVILDPLVELHTSEENDNTALRAIVAKFRAKAQELKIAVGIIHHTRKGAQANEVDAVRGASSVVGAARVVLTVTSMSEEEAGALGINPMSRRSFFRVDTPKSNYHQAHEADWHELIEHDLDNGERVAAAHPWAPKGQVISPECQVEFERIVANGHEGEPWSPRLSGKPRSVKTALLRAGIASPSGHKKALSALWAAGFSEGEFWQRARGEWADGIRSPMGQHGTRWRADSEN